MITKSTRLFIIFISIRSDDLIQETLFSLDMIKGIEDAVLIPGNDLAILQLLHRNNLPQIAVKGSNLLHIRFLQIKLSHLKVVQELRLNDTLKFARITPLRLL